MGGFEVLEEDRNEVSYHNQARNLNTIMPVAPDNKVQELLAWLSENKEIAKVMIMIYH